MGEHSVLDNKFRCTYRKLKYLLYMETILKSHISTNNFHFKEYSPMYKNRILIWNIFPN